MDEEERLVAFQVVFKVALEHNTPKIFYAAPEVIQSIAADWQWKQAGAYPAAEKEYNGPRTEENSSFRKMLLMLRFSDVLYIC